MNEDDLNMRRQVLRRDVGAFAHIYPCREFVEHLLQTQGADLGLCGTGGIKFDCPIGYRHNVLIIRVPDLSYHEHGNDLSVGWLRNFVVGLHRQRHMS